MKLLFTLFLASAPALAAPEFNICYFSLNKSDEQIVAKEFMNKLNAASSVKIKVTEFQPDKSQFSKKDLEKGMAVPNVAFRKMVESGTKCDGIVISGHHTGSYGGQRANGRLTMDYMESLSCDPKYANFFRNVNAVWLEGCRTLGAGQIAVNDNADNRFDADYHTGRVGADLVVDNLPQSYQQLNTEFTSTLDQDNPLSSRYLRLFPSAKLFGWTETAPGEKANSQYSLLYHIAHMARVMDDQDKFPPLSPLSPTLTPESVARYVDATLLALSRFSENDRKCEELATSAWIAHGTQKKFSRYSFDNEDLNALTPLTSSGNEENLMAVKKMECELKAAAKTGNVESLNQVLNSLIARPDLLPYTFNTLVDLRNTALRQLNSPKLTDSAKEKNAEVAKTILERMKTHPTVLDFMKDKVTSNRVGILRKMDYYKFYTLLTGQRMPEVEAEIENKIVGELKKPMPRTTNSSRALARDYRNTILESVTKNQLVSATFVTKIMANNPDWDVYESLAKNVDNLPMSPGEKLKFLEKIGTMPSPPANSFTASAVLTSYRRNLNALYSDGRGGLNEAGQRLYNSQLDKIWPRVEHVGDNWKSTEARQPAEANAPPTQTAPRAPTNAPAEPNIIEDNPISNFLRGIFR